MTADLTLSPDQRKAVESEAAALVVTASAGSGKTEVVARRVERLLEADPNSAGRVLAVSYTVKAAGELRSRFESRLGQVDLRVDCETIHQFAHALLRKSGTWVGLPVEPQVVTEDEDRVELLRAWLEAQGEVVADEALLDELRSIDLARSRGEDALHLAEWRAALADAGAVDYPAMVDLATDLATLPGTNRQLRRLYDHIIVDEAQNLSLAQYRLLVAIAGPPPLDRPSVMLVGDPKQSIVGFAGADASLIAQFSTDYNAEQIELSSNFRCAREIQRIVDSVGRDLGQQPTAGDSSPPAALGKVVRHDLDDEEGEGVFVASWIQDLLAFGLDPDALADGEGTKLAPEEIAVLGRSAASLREVHRALDDRGIPAAMAIRPEDWVTSIYGTALVHLMAWLSGDVFVARRALEQLLEAEDGLDDPQAAIRAMAAAGPGWGSLAAAVQDTSPASVMKALGDVRTEDSAAVDWQADRIQLAEAWSDYCTSTDLHDRSWGGFRIHVSRLQRSSDLTDGVRLMTIHKAQGREFRAVAVVGLNDGQLPDFRSLDDQAELRTFYVAVSRPSRVLLLTRAKQRATRIGPRTTDPSRFLAYVNEPERKGPDSRI